MIAKPPTLIKELFAFVSADENGNEGIMAFYTKGTMMPMIGADNARIKSLIPVADEMAKHFNRTYVIRRFIPADPHDVTENYK